MEPWNLGTVPKLSQDQQARGAVKRHALKEMQWQQAVPLGGTPIGALNRYGRHVPHRPMAEP